MSSTTEPKYRLLVEGETIKRGDTYLRSCIHASQAKDELDVETSWLPTGCSGQQLDDTHRPHRRLVESQSIPTPSHSPELQSTLHSLTPKLNLSRYLIIPEPRTKPVRYMVLIDESVYAKGLIRTNAREIVSMHAFTHLPENAGLLHAVRTIINNSGL